MANRFNTELMAKKAYMYMLFYVGSMHANVLSLVMHLMCQLSVFQAIFETSVLGS